MKEDFWSREGSLGFSELREGKGSIPEWNKKSPEIRVFLSG
jgi:hypothetical protein